MKPFQIYTFLKHFETIFLLCPFKCIGKEGGGAMAAIISSVGVAILGAASSYFAYQKKKLCFKVQGGEFGTFLQ